MTTNLKQRDGFRARTAILLLALATAGAGVAWMLLWRESPMSAENGRPTVVLADGYVSSSACQTCHAAQFASWEASFHRSMTQIPTAESAPELLSPEPVELEGIRYRFGRSAAGFHVNLEEISGGTSTREQIVLQTGSHHMHVFWIATAFPHTPALLPLSWHIEQQRWLPRHSTFVRPPEMPVTNEIGRWNDGCCNCHATHPRKRLDAPTRIWDTHVAEFGIACEACHGPGAGHVARYTGQSGGDHDAVVNPAKLAHQLQSDVCGQCHSVQWYDFDAVSQERYLADGPRFRPGDDLETDRFRHVVRATEGHRRSRAFHEWSRSEGRVPGTFWPDGTIRVAGREYNAMIESPCFAAGELSCLSCHRMHAEPGRDLGEWREDQLKSGMRGDVACLQCHAGFAERIPEHTHHAVDSSGSRCLNCHMPHTTFGLLKTIRNHRIESPSVAVRLQTGRPTACNLCHLDRTLEWTARQLAEWYGHAVPDLSPPHGDVADSVLLLLTGDAAQRALLASQYGWEPAQAAAGTAWMPPVLLLTLHDPYDAVRWIAEKSLRALPEWKDFPYDFLDSSSDRFERIAQALEHLTDLPARPELLIDEAGQFDFPRATQLLQQRDQRPVLVSE